MSIILAIGLSFLMFLGMTFLIKPDIVINEPEPTPLVIIDYKEVDDDPKLIIRKKPKLEVVKKPDNIKTVSHKPKPPTGKPDFSNIKFKTEGIKGGTILTASLGGNENMQAVPKVRINPRYPRIAATEGIEGYVTLTFDITAIGTTENINIVDAKPRNVFNRAAKKALAKWKYQPKVKNNKAIPQNGQKITLQFNLEDQLM